MMFFIEIFLAYFFSFYFPSAKFNLYLDLPSVRKMRDISLIIQLL